MTLEEYEFRLFKIIKPLATRDPPVKIYKNTRDTDLNSQDEDYLVYSVGISNVPRVYGDGKTLLRRCACDITVSERGSGNNKTAGYLTTLVENLLNEAGISYNLVPLGYVESTDSVQTTFDFYLI